METKGFYVYFRNPHQIIKLARKKIRFETEYLILPSENANIVKANLIRFAPQGNATQPLPKKRIGPTQINKIFCEDKKFVMDKGITRI
jgi:hypothetical protein